MINSVSRALVNFPGEKFEQRINFEQIEAFATAIKIHSPPATANMNPIEMHMANTLLAHLPAREIEEHTLGDFLSFSPWSGGAFSHGNTGVELFNGSKVLCALI